MFAYSLQRFIPHIISACCAVILLCLFPVKLYGATTLKPLPNYDLSSEMKASVHSGINHLYNLDFNESEIAFTDVATVASNHPVGCVYLALTEIGRSLTSGETPEINARFHRYVDMAVNRSLSLQLQKTDPWVRFYSGTAYILKAYCEGKRQNYIVSLRWLKRGIAQINHAYENNETSADAKMLIGSYRYFTSLLPWYFRFFATLLVEPANKIKGIEDLEFSASHSLFERTEAQILLATAYSWEGQPFIATELTESLSAKYPNNYCLSLLKQDILIRQHKYNEALHCATNQLGLIEKDQRPYIKGLLVNQHYIIGLIQTHKKNYHSALKHFALAYNLAKNKPYLKAWAILRQGTIYDLTQQYSKARYCYAAVKTIYHKSDLLDAYCKRFSVKPYRGEPLE